MNRKLTEIGTLISYINMRLFSFSLTQLRTMTDMPPSGKAWQVYGRARIITQTFQPKKQSDATSDVFCVD